MKIADFISNHLPKVALAVGDFDMKYADAFKKGVAILELRIDLFSSFDFGFIIQQIELYKTLNMPLLLTIRTQIDRGMFNLSEANRKDLFIKIIPYFDIVDIELTATEINKEVSKSCKEAGKLLLVSNHNFDRTPDDSELNSQVQQALELEADFVKLAFFAQNEKDVTRMLHLIEMNRKHHLIGISMGPIGTISRLVAPLFGSPITYTSLSPVYGQISLDDLVQNLRGFYPKFNQEFLESREV